MAMLKISLDPIHWRLVIASLDAAMIEVNDDLRLTRPSTAGVRVLDASLGELRFIRNMIKEKTDGV